MENCFCDNETFHIIMACDNPNLMAIKLFSRIRGLISDYHKYHNKQNKYPTIGALIGITLKYINRKILKSIFNYFDLIIAISELIKNIKYIFIKHTCLFLILKKINPGNPKYKSLNLSSKAVINDLYKFLCKLVEIFNLLILPINIEDKMIKKIILFIDVIIFYFHYLLIIF